MESSEGRSPSSSSSRLRLGLLSQSQSLLNPRQGLLSQAGELLNSHSSHTSRSTSSSTTSSSMGSAHSVPRTVSTTPASTLRGNDHNTPGTRQSSDTHSPISTSAQGGVNLSTSTAVLVTDLRQTLSDSKLVVEFRLFLRTKIDRNRSDDPDYKKMSEQWLDFAINCEKVFELPEDENEKKINFMVEIGAKFLGKPPDGYNMALQNQLNRKELINHCRNLSEGVTNEPDTSLLRDGYEYVCGKLDQKHDVFRKTYRPPTRLAALMCALS